MSPEVTILQDWPSAMCARTAGKYLEVSESQFLKLAETYPSRLRAFNFLEKGERRWSRESLDEFRRWRESIGVEKAG